MYSNKELKEILNSQLTKSGYINYKILDIELCEPIINGNGKPYYEKQRLFYIFSRRLKGCLLYDKNNPFINFLKESIDILENIPDDATIFSWSIAVDGNRITGRSTIDEILHIYPSNFASSIVGKT
jgi:hypothetical protein